MAAEINLNGTGDEYGYSPWEAAEIVLSQAASVTSVEFVNGSSDGGTSSASGYFTSSFLLQTSADGISWADATGWALSPVYPNDRSANNKTYTFTGLATSVLAVRVVSQVGTSGYNGSWHANAREIRVWGLAGVSGALQSLEVENLAYTASLNGASESNDACSAGTCRYVQLNEPASVGAWIEFSIPSLPAGTYGATLYYKSNTNRGIAQDKMDGIAFPETCDEYASAAAFLVPCDLGSSSLATSGSHKLRFTVTGRNPASSSYMITVDRIVLTPM